MLLRTTVCLGLLCALISNVSAATDDTLRPLISRGDLRYPKPVERSEDGLPLGNGRMGSLVWTSPSALRLQINRNDIQPINKDTTSFFERNQDYMGGAGYVDVDFGGATEDVFSAENCPQHLSIYDGLMTIEGRGVSSRLVAWPAQDVFAIEFEDQRTNPQPVSIQLRMLRYLSQYHNNHEALVKSHTVLVRNRHHTAASQLHVVGDRIVLTQEFKEGTHVSKSAVAVALLGRKGRPQLTHETEVRLLAPAARGRATVLIASAASLDPKEDVVAAALAALDAATPKSFVGLAAETAQWWRDFWRRGSVDLRSPDGTAEYIADNYHYFLYLMGATSRGKFPVKFNGMLFNTAGDMRTWGVLHWYANTSCVYEAMYATNRLDLLQPFFDMFSNMYDSLATAARQQWGSQGIYIPETVFFDGLNTLPDDIAAEMRELYLVQKPWQPSDRFLEYARTKLPHLSRWNWKGRGGWVEGQWVPDHWPEYPNTPYGRTVHILGTTAKVAYFYWRQYEYTLDREWLRTRAYPMIKGAAEFYRNFPNLKKEEDGKLHIHHTNSNESLSGVRDSDEDIAAMRGIFPVAIRAAEILEVDPELRTAWRDTLAQLTSIPTTADADAHKPAEYNGPQVFIRARKPVVYGRGLTPDGNSLPHLFFDLCNLDNPDKEILAIANATFERGIRGGLSPQTRVHVLSKMGMAAATLGRADATRFLISAQIRADTPEREGAYLDGRPLQNRLSLREGHQAMESQRLGRASEALHTALLNSAPPAPGADSNIRLFAAWPQDWDATFTLRARGAFVVTASRQKGTVEWVEILSEAGAPLRLHNPWGEAEVTVSRSGGATEKIRGPLLTLTTTRGERLRFVNAAAR